MAELRVANIDGKLMAKVKAEAALAQMNIKDFVAILLTEALFLRLGRKRK